MSARRIAAIAVIYVLTSIAWLILGTVTSFRTNEARSSLGYGAREGEFAAGRSTVEDLWGAAQLQHAPVVWSSYTEQVATKNEKGKTVLVTVKKTQPAVLSSTRLNVAIESEPRRKGLLWYSTYKVRFAGDYTLTSELPVKRTFHVKFTFPVDQVAFNNVKIRVGGKRISPSGDLSQGLDVPVDLVPGQSVPIHFAYGSQGLDKWEYQFTEDDGMSSVRDFAATITTDCRDIDFPNKCLSPTDKKQVGDGWVLNWKYGDLVSGSKVGVSMPQPLQPGPLASRLSLFAPVSLLFFFAVLLIMGTVSGVKLHPVHYLFLAATFFSFHLLFSYLVDHIYPFPAFLTASAVSLLLTVSYVRLPVGWRFAVRTAGFWQFIFLVLFAYAFFFEGYTGLTITIGAIITLAAMMQLTGRVNWDEALAQPEQPPRPLHLYQSPPPPTSQPMPPPPTQQAPASPPQAGQ